MTTIARDQTTTARAATPGQVFVARQPILDRSRRVFGYELLFRTSVMAEVSDSASEQASARVITDAPLSADAAADTQ